MSSNFVYFITGGNRGIGFELVKLLSTKHPLSTIITSVRDLNRSERLKEYAEISKNVKIVKLDVSDEDSINRLEQQLSNLAPNGIDTFISNAAIAEPDAYYPIIEVPKPVWMNHYITNVVGPILITQKVLKHLEMKPTKQIVWISSIAGTINWLESVKVSISAYGQSKAALNYSFKALSNELAPKGYTVVAVHPGSVRTDMGGNGFTTLKKNHPETMPDPDEVLIRPEDSAIGLVTVFDGLTKEDNGKFLSYNGSEVSM